MAGASATYERLLDAGILGPLRDESALIRYRDAKRVLDRAQHAMRIVCVEQTGMLLSYGMLTPEVARQRIYEGLAHVEPAVVEAIWSRYQSAKPEDWSGPGNWASIGMAMPSSEVLIGELTRQTDSMISRSTVQTLINQFQGTQGSTGPSPMASAVLPTSDLLEGLQETPVSRPAIASGTSPAIQTLTTSTSSYPPVPIFSGVPLPCGDTTADGEGTTAATLGPTTTASPEGIAEEQRSHGEMTTTFGRPPPRAPAVFDPWQVISDAIMARSPSLVAVQAFDLWAPDDAMGVQEGTTRVGNPWELPPARTDILPPTSKTTSVLSMPTTKSPPASHRPPMDSVPCYTSPKTAGPASVSIHTLPLAWRHLWS